jgi:hypothetical protein
VTHGADEDEGNASLVHLAWWKVGAGLAEPWYALVALERDEEPVTSFASLTDLAALTVDISTTAEPEDTGAARETAVTSVTIKPRKIGGTARIFVPVGRKGHKTPRANLISSSENPLQAIISRNGRIVLYAPGERFSFVVLDNGEWTPVRTLKVDEKMTMDHVLKDLRNTVEELETLTVPQLDR